MRERIEKIIEKEGMPQAKFAEEIGIQRATLSHILNERNNVSLDVLMKILARFDYLNTDWLLFGTGNMYKTDKAVVQPSLFINESDEFLPESTAIGKYPTENEVEKPNIVTKQTEKEEIIIKNLPRRKVEKILLFYSDDTFESFVPQKEEK